MKFSFEKMSKALESDQAFEILDTCAGGTFQAGGCLLLSKSLLLLFPSGKLKTLYGARKSEDPMTSQHVVFELNGRLIDADGYYFEEADLLYFWVVEKREGHYDRIKLEDFDENKISSCISSSKDYEEKLAKLIKEEMS